jgi:transcriptional regulator with XRE-family HTH domain
MSAAQAFTRREGNRMPAPKTHAPVPSLRHWRIAQHWTQRQLAEKAKVAESTVAHGEQGYTISLLTAKKLADTLGVSVSQLRAPEPEE